MSTCLVPMPTGDTCIRIARPYSSSYWSAACFVAILGIELPNTGRSPAPSILLKVRQVKPGGVGSHVKENTTESF